PVEAGAAHAAPAAPRTPAEEVLTALFAEVLRKPGVGVHDDFFALGGHSLIATRLISRVREAFRVEVPLRALFAAPTPAALAERVEGLLRADAGLQAPPLVPVPRDGDLPLSFAQQRLWFIQQMDPRGVAYNMPHALRLRGPLDLDVLERALDALVARHESLRTVFPARGGEPVQVVLPPAPVRPARADLSALEPDAREAELRRRMREEAERPFDLAAAPALRVTLLRLDHDDTAVLFTLHHIVSDGWSRDVLVREMSELYAALAEGRPPVLPALPVQYADFAAWQRAWLAGPVLEGQLGYWRGRLAGAPPLLALPTDRPRTAAPGARAEGRSFVLSPAASRGLRALSRAEGATLFMTLLAGFQALLGRYAGQDDVVVGTPVAGRSRLEVENLIGFFVNLLALRTDLSGDPAFRALVHRVREGVLQAHAHQDLPFEQLVHEIQPERTQTSTPVFQALFALDTAAEEPLALGQARAVALGGALEAAKFDLSLAMHDAGERIGGTLLFRTDLFDGATVEGMAAHLARLLEAVAADPDAPLSAVSLLDEAQRERLLGAWSGTRADYPRDASLHALFAEQAARTPHAVALSAGGEALTYAALERRANRLAHHLRRRGVGPESRVGLCLERSADLVVAVLAILKAGGAYVPLDPVYPRERLAFMLADAGVSVLVSETRLAGVVPTDGVATVLLDAARDEIAREPGDDPRVEVPAEALAYVVYTSGSTGTPKGVAVPHRAVLRLARGGSWVRLGAEETVLQLAPIAFDASTFEIWGALLNGARLAVFPAGTPSLAELAAELERQRVTTLWLTAGLFHQLVDEHPAAFRHVRQLLAGGDVLSPAHVRRVLEAVPGLTVINGYGPTENTTFSATHAVRAPDEAGASVPIGRAVENSTVYVLDGGMRPMPVGVPGELFTGGDGLARGYAGRPALTAGRFVPDPFAGAPGARLYRTGDRVRWTAGGTLEFLGRVDTQVKLRGYRVEPGEVEAVLLRRPDVREAVVEVRADGGERRLVAYVVPARAGTLTPAELRGALAGTLPEYLVPSAFVLLEALPLTPNGKVDRRALPAPDFASGAAAEYEAPRTPVEETLAGIMADVLGVERVGRDDGFFELGGHSLMATRMMSRVRAALGAEVELRALFDAPTPAALAQRVEAVLRAGAGVQAPPLEPAPRGGALPLSFAQQRLWFIEQLRPGQATYNIPVALRLRGELDASALERALTALVERHEVLRTTFGTVAGEPVQVVAPAAPFTLPVEDLRGLSPADRDDAVRRMTDEEAGRPFDLAAGAPFRARLARLDTEAWAAFFTMHHIASDGWSMGVLVREVSELYGAFAGERAPALAPLPVQYADFAAWQRGWLAGGVLDAQMAWWRDRLAGAPPLLEIPTDRPRPP
ncbi:amino acid adenylation domain-containing protein, partial [Longimicrobium sp.]|uniref:amino acid adenylation domain-containing protein n=1 Tax=Longimicrobium sp. TaxID=2029185 RepID=UPI002E323A7A